MSFKLSLSLKIVWFWLLLPSAYADSAYESYIQQNNSDYLSTNDRNTLDELHSREQRGADGLGLNGSVGKAGEVIFAYGSSRPVIVCAILELCDIALQAGERVNTVQIGDSARWQVSAAMSGVGSESIAHLIIKPLDVGLKTSMLITTDKRSYHLQLKSTYNDFMPQIRFVYPEQELSNINDVFAQANYNARVISDQNGANNSVGRDNSKLDFNYSCSGDDEIMPKRVYHDGKKTYIELEPSNFTRRLPGLLITKASNSFMGKDKAYLANSHYENGRFVVQGVIDTAKLILGTDDGSYEVKIEYQD